jgi:hypothetical protein
MTYLGNHNFEPEFFWALKTLGMVEQDLRAVESSDVLTLTQ